MQESKFWQRTIYKEKISSKFECKNPKIFPCCCNCQSANSNFAHNDLSHIFHRCNSIKSGNVARKKPLTPRHRFWDFDENVKLLEFCSFFFIVFVTRKAKHAQNAVQKIKISKFPFRRWVMLSRDCLSQNLKRIYQVLKSEDTATRNTEKFKYFCIFLAKKFWFFNVFKSKMWFALLAIIATRTGHNQVLKIKLRSISDNERKKTWKIPTQKKVLANIYCCDLCF